MTNEQRVKQEEMFWKQEAIAGTLEGAVLCNPTSAARNANLISNLRANAPRTMVTHVKGERIVIEY